MTNSGGQDDNLPYDESKPPVYGEIPSLPRDGYGVSESGAPTYQQPTEQYPGYQQPGYQQPQYGQQQPPPQYGQNAFPPPPPYGAPAPYGPPMPYGPQSMGTNGMAIASLVASIAGGWFCFIGPILGIIFGIVGLNQIKQRGQQGRGMAIAGICIGGVVLVLSIVYIVVLIAVAANDSSY